MLYGMVVGVNWLTLCPECHRPGSVSGTLLLLLYTSDLYAILENKLIGYADDQFDGCCAIPGR